MKSSLLCTFGHVLNFNLIVDYININYKLPKKSIYIFNNFDYPDELYFTYNVENCDSFIENTILIHRKKQTNTLYTINALNSAIKAANNGLLDQSFKLNWEGYQNSILLTDHDNFKVVPLELYTVKNFS